MAGDIVISAEIAEKTRAGLGHSAAEEIKVLACTACFISPDTIMTVTGSDGRKETLRHSLGLPVGLIERNGRRTGQL